MTPHSEGFKARMIQRMAGPEAISAMALAREVGVSQGTLSRWLRHAVATSSTVAVMKDKNVPSRGGGRPSRTAEEKLDVVIKAGALPEEDLGAFLRREGLHEAQLDQWRSLSIGALKAPHAKRSERTPEFRRIKELERDLLRKDRALAEVTALLALKKKIQEIWGDEGDDTHTRSAT